VAPQLSVVIVNYHQWGSTAALTRQLQTSQCMRRCAAEVVIVDNHSPPHPLLARLRRSPGVALRRWGRNRGFARAVNEGCRLSQGEWLLLLNPDMTLPPEFLDQVFALAERLSATEPRTGIVGFGLRNPDGTAQHSSGPFPSLLGTLARLILPRARRKYRVVPRDRRSEVDWVTGCCVLIRRACLAALGGLDEDFFLYYEDVDLCRRAQAHGWSVQYEPALTAVHHHPLHSRPVPPALRLITRHSLLTYGRKHWPTWQCQLLAWIVRAESWLRRLRALCRGNQIAARIFGEMGALATALGKGQKRDARRCLQRVAQAEEPLGVVSTNGK
jgi:GT2 family glycosyltransferase